MTPEIAVAKIALELLKSEELRHDLAKINRGLEEISGALDQLITREMGAAFQALAEAQATTREDVRASRLQLAEHLFLLNANLDARRETSAERNDHLIARAFSGLALASRFRGDEELACSYVLRAFEVDPRQARVDLFPETFKNFFVPLCADLFAWLQDENAKIEAEMPALRKRSARKAKLAGQVALGAGVVMAPALALEAGLATAVALAVNKVGGESLHSLRDSARDYLKGAEEFVARKADAWIESDARGKAKGLSESLERSFQDKLDTRCTEVARSLLHAMDDIKHKQP